HDEQELRRATDAGCDVIGVNSRDLRTFKVDLDTVFRLTGIFPENVVRVAESGIQRAEDITRLRAAGDNTFLVGQLPLRAERPGDALKELLTTAVSKFQSFNVSRS